MPGKFPSRGPRHALPGAIKPNPWDHARVLVVDDHSTYRLLLSTLLEKLGVAHQCCCDGEQALHALALQRFDLVISDCRMPGMDGYAMTRELRRRERVDRQLPTTVLGFTASLGPEEIRKCVLSGMDGWLTKPIGFAQLREVLRYWLAPQPTDAAHREGARVARQSSFPSRASLIAAFGSWDVVEPMLFSLIQEAHADLAVLIHAQATLDARLAAQCLHRLVGSVAFLGETGLEAQTLALIGGVRSAGVAINGAAVDALRREVEAYLNYLSCL
ncbi:response regulator [Pseudomonas sp. Marseille-Q1929]|uniref:response regulator n=1 Tax=Pseudomonas sp. Marseille-Q1929 TaxID=2730402 RepID=UPI001A90B637|nr:response regulator [Pseudomonas sp. Marseille-Q1929]MBO0491810.1 response regulator [Pseudomonas sp. Marseille-Q1929]